MEATFYLLLIWLLYLPVTFSQNIHTNNIDEFSNEITGSVNDAEKDTNQFEDIATSTPLFESNAAGDVANILSNFLHTEGGKTMENVVLGAMKNPDTTNQILSGITTMLNQNNAGAALDPAVIGNVLSFMAASGGDHKKSGQEQITENVISFMANMMSQQQQHKNKENTMDLLGSVASTISNLFTDSGENPISLLLSSLNSFIGPDADKRESQHASHAYLLPPLLEKAHLYFDHFKHTELYKALWRISGAEKIFQLFAVEGKFNFAKFFDRLENKNFRKHWIHIVTKKITDVIAFVTDSSRYKKYVSTVVSLFNGFLKSADFPKSTLFDITRPNETLTNFFNYFLRKYLTLDVNSAQYVTPAVAYVEDILRLAHDRGFLFKDGLNSKELAQKLTDTLNLEIIEPMLRVWRAYRFAKKVPECDKYVMCLINQEDPHEKMSLPGLKMALSKTASMFASWFLSENTGTSFWTLYSTIHDESDCSVRFMEKCNNFHIEEGKIDSEYTHTEL